MERAFGVLQARFAIIRNPARLWRTSYLKAVMRACIILHNMIIEDERDVEGLEDIFGQPLEEVANVDRDTTNNSFSEFLERRVSVRDTRRSHQLRQDLIDHLWSRAGDQQ